MFAAAVPPRQAAPDVILITIDTVRADHLSCYGAKDIQTPTLDSLARDGTLFERAVSQVRLHLALPRSDPDRDLPVPEWGAGFHRTAAR